MIIFDHTKAYVIFLTFSHTRYFSPEIIHIYTYKRRRERKTERETSKQNGNISCPFDKPTKYRLKN